MATSGREQVADHHHLQSDWPESLPPRPSHEWTKEDVAGFLDEMKLCKSATDTFKSKHKISSLFVKDETQNIFPGNAVNGKEILQRHWTKADLSKWNR